MQQPHVITSSAAALAVMLAFSSPCWAQTTFVRASLPNVPQGSPIGEILPPKLPQLGVGLPNTLPQTNVTSMPLLLISVRSVIVVGVTAFPSTIVDAIVNKLTNSPVLVATIEQARLNLLNLYRRHGFLLTTVSVTIDTTRNAQFVVTEGRISKVRLSKDVGAAGKMVLRFLNHLTAERPLSEASLERWLLLAQQVPGIAVHAVLQADQDDPGDLTLIAEVSKQGVSALATVDNRGFTNTGPVEGLGVADLNSVTSFGDQSEVSLFHTSGGTDNFGQVSESWFLGDYGLRIKLYGGSGRSNPTGSLRQISYESSTTIFGAQLSYPLILRRNQALTLSTQIDGIDNNINILNSRASADDLRIGRVEELYAWLDLWAGDTRGATNILDIRQSQGIPSFGASVNGRTAPLAGRAAEKIDFWKLNGSISRTQTLFTPFENAKVALRIEAGGQYTTDVLPSEEEFYLGGRRYTRGYYSGEVVGDKGAYATSELQLNIRSDIVMRNEDIPLLSQIYCFYDWGETWPNLKTDLRGRIESIGGGFRMGLSPSVEFDGEVVRRLVTQLTRPAIGIAALSRTVLYFGITTSY